MENSRGAVGSFGKPDFLISASWRLIWVNIVVSEFWSGNGEKLRVVALLQDCGLRELSFLISGAEVG